MTTREEVGRRNCIPIVYCKGTHYEVGFDVGRTFRGLINNLLERHGPLNNVYLPLYETPNGREVYESTLAAVKENFPQYVREIEGTADGAIVPFHKLFLLHLDDILPNAVGQKANLTTGCSTVYINQPGHEIMGHTEDAIHEMLNHVYLVSAHIITDTPQGRWKVREERFTSTCYAGHLPGYASSYNHHGLIFCVNTLYAKTLVAGKTPRHILSRALLAAENMDQVQQILRDEGHGAADAMSINMTFLLQDIERLFHNIEVGPAIETNESLLDTLTICPGKHYFHSNHYLRLKVPETPGFMMSHSNRRHAAKVRLGEPNTLMDAINILGDQNDIDKHETIFRDHEKDLGKTVCIGIFDCIARTWSIYTDNPKTHEPIAVLPLMLKSSC